jgi:hypothetical protein
MSTRSIYHKPCPSCAAAVVIEATHCRCGYAFDVQTTEADMLPDDQFAQEQELLREYLHARIGQAVDSLQNVQAALAADPKNLDKAARLMKAYVALHELRAEAQSITPVEPPQVATTPPVETVAESAAAIPSAEAGSDQDPTAFRAAQARKAEQVMKAAGMETKDCPKCRAVVPLHAALCFCGFAFSHPDTSIAPADSAAETEDRVGR